MFKSLICLELLRIVSGALVPYGGGWPYPGSGYPIYPMAYSANGFNTPLLAHGSFYNGLSNHMGDGRHYNHLNSNGLMYRSLGSAGALANGGGHGFAGDHRYADQHQGIGGYHSDNFGRDFNSGGGAFRNSNGFHDAAGRGSMGGFNNIGHNKGHKTTGFHKSYHNVETGRDTKYVDEDHDSGDENVGQEFGNNFANAYGTGFNSADTRGQYGMNRHSDQVGHRGLNGGQFSGGRFGGHGENNFHNGQDLALRDYHLANDMNYNGQGYHGVGNRYGSGITYFPQSNIW